jgi:hypothetical protein
MIKELPADLLHEAVSILDFLSEVLSALDSPHPNNGLSCRGIEGLILICLHLSGLCQQARDVEG